MARCFHLLRVLQFFPPCPYCLLSVLLSRAEKIRMYQPKPYARLVSSVHIIHSTNLMYFIRTGYYLLQLVWLLLYFMCST